MSRSSVLESGAVIECLERLAASRGSVRPLAVYRMQFHAGFRFQDARRLVSYLQALGVTHLYSSPILKARAGSMHGYDIVDHNAINPDLGTEEDFHALVAELKAAGLGVLLDIVPNHMGVGYGSNSWWQDVLENGPASAYAEFFDIDWEPLKSELHAKVLLPVLGGQYGEELEQGRIQLQWDDGFLITYFDRNFLTDPKTWPLIFGQGGAQGGANELSLAAHDLSAGEKQGLAELLAALGDLPPRTVTEPELVERRRKEPPELKRRLVALVHNSQALQHLLKQVLEKINGIPGNPVSFDALHQFLEAQAYRLAHWKVSAEEINYRRFFDINDLVGVRMENPAVFTATHRLLRRWLADGSIDGLRLDHPDGLFNPVQYFTRLQMLYAASQCCGPEPQGEVGENGIELEVQHTLTPANGDRRPLYILVEKILEAGEQLPDDWSVDGTVGYEFGSLLTNLFIESRNRRAFTNAYHRFIGGPIDPDAVIYESKKLILHHALASEVGVLTLQLQKLSSADRHARDFTLKMLADAIREVIACFPVYRTYVDARGNVSERDRAYIVEAVARAKRRNESTAAAVFDYLREILLLESGQRTAGQARRQLYFTMKFQQLTGPTMAKGLEDTSCYIYNRLLSVNEVGGSPRDFGISLEEFHRGNQLRAERWPHQLLNTSTHDSKRSEDVRARLNMLSEMPKTWSAQVLRWRRCNRTKKRIISDGRLVPDANEEYLLYQTLVGSWPFSPFSLESASASASAGERQEFSRRIQQYMTKAVHEAKVNLSWTNPNPEYVHALEQFISKILEPGRRKPNAFLEQIGAFLPAIMFFGALNSIAQTLIKLTVPGVPDVYQGQEMFDFSLVDPDNRRPVDYAVRQQFLFELLEGHGSSDRRQLCRDLIANYRDGRLKLWATLQALRFRRQHPELFRLGSYTAVEGLGEKKHHLVAFAREHQGEFALVIAPRFSCTLLQGDPAADFGSAWGDTTMNLPLSSPERLTNVLTGEEVAADTGVLRCRELFTAFPLALLTRA